MQSFTIDFDYRPMLDAKKCQHSSRVVCTKCSPSSFPKKYLSQSDPTRRSNYHSLQTGMKDPSSELGDAGVLVLKSERNWSI